MKQILNIAFLIIVLSGILGLASCNKLFPFKFSDANNVTFFEVNKNSTTGIILSQDVQINTNVDDGEGGTYGQITLTVANGSQYFPLVFNVNIEVSTGASIHNWPKELQLAFKTPSDTKLFYVVSSSGHVKKWIIRIADNTPIPPDPSKKNANILSFNFSPTTSNGIEINPTEINIVEDSILLSYDSDGTTDIAYPVTINNIVTKIPTGAFVVDVNGDQNIGVSVPTIFNFIDNKDVKIIRVKSADSTTTKDWKIALKKQVLAGGSGAAEITDFKMYSILPSAVSVPSSMKGLIDAQNRKVYIVEYNAYDFSQPVKIVMDNLAISENSKITNEYTGVFTFSSFNDVKTIQITAENGKQKNWQIILLYSPQINNNGFEKWSSGSFPTIDGGQWVNNNNQPPMVSAVIMVEPSSDAFAGSKSAKLTTRCITRGAAGQNATTPVSGGSIFVGNFNFSASEGNIRNPSAMYNYGVSFGYAPTYMKLAFKYKPSSPLYKATIDKFDYLFGNALPRFSTTALSQPDACIFWIKVYDNGGNIIGQGEFATSNTFEEWQEIYIPVIYTNNNAEVGKIAINCSSSKDALQYIGASGGTSGNADGSTLYIDEVELMYTPIEFKQPNLP